MGVTKFILHIFPFALVSSFFIGHRSMAIGKVKGISEDQKAERQMSRSKKMKPQDESKQSTFNIIVKSLHIKILDRIKQQSSRRVARYLLKEVEVKGKKQSHLLTLFLSAAIPDEIN